ncbi:MAG: hypothetical protein KBG54_05440 [Oscillospiraceae bacterium]|nr:hypothetical protein [Oscillospiraceae bacterium]
MQRARRAYAVSNRRGAFLTKLKIKMQGNTASLPVYESGFGVKRKKAPLIQWQKP